MTAAAICFGCGHEPGDGDRYCADCGLSLRGTDVEVIDESPAAVGTVASRIREPADPDPASSPSSSAPGPSSPRTFLLPVLAAALLGLLTWWTLAAPTQVLDGVAFTLTAVDARVPTEWDEGLAGEPLIEVYLTSFDDPSTDPDAVPISVLPEADLPILDVEQLTGLDDQWLIVSNQTHLVRIDPATGTSQLFDVGGLVVGHDGSRLIIVSVGTGEVRSASSSDPEGDQRLLLAGDGARIADIELPGDGTLTVVSWVPPDDPNADIEEFESVTVDLGSGGTVSRSRNAEWPGAQRDLGFDPGWGSFEIGPDGEARLLTDGFVEAAGDDVALIQRCDDPETCERFWLDRESGQRLDRPLPAETDRFSISEVFGPDDRFVSIQGVSGRAYFDTAKATYFAGPETTTAESSFGIVPQAMSPDGRYLMIPARAGVIVHDVESGTSGLLEVDIPGSPLSIHIVPKGVDEP